MTLVEQIILLAKDKSSGFRTRLLGVSTVWATKIPKIIPLLLEKGEHWTD
jgi:hypothetical protein